MKLLPYLLVNVLVVGSGLFLYDTLKSDPQPAAFVPVRTASDEPVAPSPEPGAVVISGADAEFLAKRNKVRLDELEAALAVLRRGSTATAPAGDGGATSGEPTLGNGAMNLPEAEAGNAVSFDERTLSTLKTYMDEIRRRDEEQRRREGITQELARLDVKLSDAQNEALIDATLTYQDKARDLMRKGFDRTEEGQNQRREAFEGLRTDYVAVVNSLVPSVEAEKITSGRLGRSFGFFGRGDEGGPGARFTGTRRGTAGEGGR